VALERTKRLSLDLSMPPWSGTSKAYVKTSRKRTGSAPNPHPDAAIDWLTSSSISWRAQAAWNSDPDLSACLENSRLNASRGIAEHMTEPQMQSALARHLEYSEPAIENLDRLTVRGT
jgi:hypothetical protein